MTKQRGPDKNLQNVVKDLEKPHINAFYDNQMNQKSNDRHDLNMTNHDEESKLTAGGLKHVKT